MSTALSTLGGGNGFDYAYQAFRNLATTGGIYGVGYVRDYVSTPKNLFLLFDYWRTFPGGGWRTEVLTGFPLPNTAPRNPYQATAAIYNADEIAAAKDSARAMALERDELRHDAGQEPLGYNERREEYWADAYLSALQFAFDDLADREGRPRQVILLEYDVQPYTHVEAAYADFTRSKRMDARRQKLAAQLAQAAAQNVTTGNAVVDAQINKIRTTILNPIPQNALLPVIGGNNISAETYSPDRLARVALRGASTLDIITQNFTRATELKQGNAAERWKKDAPKVQLLAADNPTVNTSLLSLNATGEPKRLVTVRVTPQTKPKPELGFLGGWGGTVLGIVASAIPVLGTAISIGVKSGAASSKKTYAGAMKSGAQIDSAFAPQYSPKPIFIRMTLAAARAAVKEPWRLPIMVEGI